MCVRVSVRKTRETQRKRERERNHGTGARSLHLEVEVQTLLGIEVAPDVFVSKFQVLACWPEFTLLSLTPVRIRGLLFAGNCLGGKSP